MRDIKADLSGTDKFPALPAGTVEYSIFPHVRRPHYADRLGIYTRMNAWHGVAEQIGENMDDSKWLRANNVGAVAAVFARVSHQMGRCRFPHYFTPTMA